jgi:hypothetical protein
LITLRVGCPSCGTELSGHFTQCRYCQLDGVERAILEVFLRGRGNVKDVQSFLGVSYPTARQRVSEMLGQLGLAEPTDPVAGNAGNTGPAAGRAGQRTTGPEPDPGPQHSDVARTEPGTPGISPDSGAVLAALANGQITVAEAESMLSGSHRHG